MTRAVPTPPPGTGSRAEGWGGPGGGELCPTEDPQGRRRLQQTGTKASPAVLDTRPPKRILNTSSEAWDEDHAPPCASSSLPAGSRTSRMAAAMPHGVSLGEARGESGRGPLHSLPTPPPATTSCWISGAASRRSLATSGPPLVSPFGHCSVSPLQREFQTPLIIQR